MPCQGVVRFPVGDVWGDIIMYEPQRSSEPTRYGWPPSPVWEVLAPMLRTSAKFEAAGQAYRPRRTHGRA